MGIGRRDPNYGQGEHTIAADEVDSLLLGRDEVIDLLRGVFSDPSYQPPMLPASALEVHRLSTLAEVDIADVVSVLEQDQMLASGALRMAQSPLYAARVPPASLKEAVARMGLNNIRDLAFGVAFQSEVFRAPGYAEVMGRIRKHCVAAGHVARMIARGTPHAEYAFLCGLLHDVGMAAIVLVLAGEKRKVVPEVLAEALVSLHEEAGVLVSRQWGLPEGLEPAIAGHHHPKSLEGALARVADCIATECGFGVVVGDIELDVPGASIRKTSAYIKLTDEALETLRKDAAVLLKSL